MADPDNFGGMFDDERSINSRGSSMIPDSLQSLRSTQTREKKLDKKDEDEVTSRYYDDKRGGAAAGAGKIKYNGRMYKIHTGSRGGKYILVNKNKKYIS